MFVIFGVLRVDSILDPIGYKRTDTQTDKKSVYIDCIYLHIHIFIYIMVTEYKRGICI